MRNRYAFLNLVIPLLVAQAGCVQQVILDIPVPPEQLAVVCHFTPGTPFVVDVTKTLPIWSEEEPQPVRDAVVSIWKDGQIVDQLSIPDDGTQFFISDDPALPGSTYYIQVEADGYPTATASSMAPESVELLPIAYNPKLVRTIDLGNGKASVYIPLKIQLASFPDGDHFYAFQIRHQIERTDDDGSLTRSEHPTMFSADGRTTSLLYDVPDHSVLVHEKYWDINYRYMNLHAVVPINNDGKEKVKRLSIEWRTLSREYYKYYLSLATQNNDGIFVEPDALFNNIEGGIGNFSGYSTHTTIIPVR